MYEYGVFKSVDGDNYRHTCLYLALKAGGLPDIKLQELLLSLRDRHIHKCDLRNVCNTLEIHIELISLRNGGGTNRVEHYGKEYGEKYNLGLVKRHCPINGYTELTSYCSEHYEEIQYIKDCSKTYKGSNGKYKKGNDRLIKTFQVFKILTDTVDKLIIPMELTDEVLNTQFYDKVEEHKTSQYNMKTCKLEEYVDTCTNQCKMFFDFETITSEYKHMPYLCWVYKDDIQHEFIGFNTCAADMLNALPTDKGDILLIAHNSDYDCIFI